jgi:dolichol-phosphate mannosyltransferase
MDPRDIEALLRPVLADRAEYSKGCRFHHFRDLAAMPRARLGGNIALTFLTKVASGYWHVLDPQNGFVAIRADVLRRLPLARLARGYFFENDMLIRLNALEARVEDVPLPSRYGNETSSLRPGRALVEFPFRLVGGFFRRLFWRYLFHDVSPVAIFFLSGALLFLFGAIFGAYHWIRNAPRNVPTPTGTVMIAAMPIILGFQLILQALVLDVQNSPRAGSDRRRGREG